MRPAGSLPVTIGGNVTTEQILLTSNPPQTPLVLGIGPASSTENKVLRGAISGYTSLKAAGNFIVGLYAGRAPLVAGNTQLASLTFAQPAGYAPWGILIPGAIYSAAWGKLMGSVSALPATSGVPAAAAGFLAQVPLVGDPTGGALAYLSLTFTFAAADPSNLAALTDFNLDTF